VVDQRGTATVELHPDRVPGRQTVEAALAPHANGYAAGDPLNPAALAPPPPGLRGRRGGWDDHGPAWRPGGGYRGAGWTTIGPAGNAAPDHPWPGQASHQADATGGRDLFVGAAVCRTGTPNSSLSAPWPSSASTCDSAVPRKGNPSVPRTSPPAAPA